MSETNEYQGYASHIPVLRKILKIMPDIKQILETGMGLYSTNELINSGAYVTSIEMNSREWFDNMVNKYKDSATWTPILELDIVDAVRQVKGFGYADLVFIDGNGDNRFDQINAAFNIAPVIVVHDTEEAGYQWERVVLPAGWEWINVIELRPWTSVVSCNTQILEMFR